MSNSLKKPLDPEALLAQLDPQQRQVAQQVHGPLCVRAGAGTGKTRAITYRLAYGVSVGAFEPQSVLAVTFTAKAAAEMRERLQHLGVGRIQARTFHSAALRQLRFFWPSVFGGQMPSITRNKASLIAAAASRLGINVDKALVRDLAAEIEWAKVSMVPADAYVQAALQSGRGQVGSLTSSQVGEVYRLYEEAKQERQVIDFEDVLALMAAILAERDDIAQQIRKQYSVFVVDEYQDVSALQQHLLALWLGKRKDICVVGDVAQTIYSFAGADPKYLVDFAQQYPEANVVELHRDYRSTPQIVAVANQIVKQSAGLQGAVHLVSQRPSGPGVEFLSFSSDDAEAQFVTDKIREVQAAGTPLSNIAILYRTNAQSEVFEKMLAEAGISAQVHGGQRFFERAEIKEAVVLLKQAARAQDLVADGDQVEYSFIDQVKEVVSTCGWSPSAPSGSGAVRERWENLDALVSLAQENPKQTLTSFVQLLSQREQTQVAPEINGVTLCTLHAAKGLEWDVVFLVGASEGLIPISRAELPSAIDEERRLMYVGVTRARDQLFVSWAKTRGGGRSRQRKLSRFLEPLWPKETAQTFTPRDKRRARVSEQARFKTDSDPATIELFEDLRVWRAQQAKEVSKPAYTIMNDVTLRAIAQAKPRTLRQLGVLPGIGAVRSGLYGAEVLQIVRAHLTGASTMEIQGKGSLS